MFHNPQYSAFCSAITPPIQTLTRLTTQVAYQPVAIWRAVLLLILGIATSACTSIAPPANTTQAAPMNAPSVALVLGGGGAKGFAHVGVIQALEENGITPTIVVGTSVGSLVGSLYASGTTPTTLEQLALTTSDDALMDFTLSNQGFVQGIKLKNFVNTHVKGRVIEDFPMTFAAIAAEKDTLKKAVFTSGNAGLAVQASCSVPNIFIAPRIPEQVGKKYIDGGVVSLVPVDSARDLGADIVIAVDVTATDKTASRDFNRDLLNITSLSSFWLLLEQNFNTVNNAALNANSGVSHTKKINSEIERADVLISPKVGHISALDTSQRRALIDAGIQATTPQINAIKQLIAKNSHLKELTP